MNNEIKHSLFDMHANSSRFQILTMNHHELIVYHDEFSKNSYEKVLNVYFVLFVTSKNLLKCQKINFYSTNYRALKVEQNFEFRFIEFFKNDLSN